MSGQNTLLAVISNQALVAKIEGLMRRRSLEVHHVSSGAAALVLAGNMAYDVVLVETPLPDLRIRDLLAAMRGLDSRSDDARFLVLSTDGSLPETLATRRDSTVRVVGSDATPERIHQALTELLGLAARRNTRLLVEVEIEVGEGSRRHLFQSINLSQSGILLRGGDDLEPGAQLSFALALPGGRSVLGQAIVVRRTSPDEPVHGTALRFLDLDESGRANLREFVNATLEADDEPMRAVAGD